MPGRRGSRRKVDSCNNSQSSSSQYWDLEFIRQESSKNYLIRWAGIDPQTGRQWEDTWVPKTCATWKAIRAWNEWKKAHSGEAVRTEGSPVPSQESQIASSGGHRSRTSAWHYEFQSRKRKRFVVEEEESEGASQQIPKSSRICHSSTPNSSSSASYVHAVSTPESRQQIVVVIPKVSQPLSTPPFRKRSGRKLTSAGSSSIANSKSDSRSGLVSQEPQYNSFSDQFPLNTSRSIVPDSQSLQDSGNAKSYLNSPSSPESHTSEYLVTEEQYSGVPDSTTNLETPVSNQITSKDESGASLHTSTEDPANSLPTPPTHAQVISFESPGSYLSAISQLRQATHTSPNSSRPPTPLETFEQTRPSTASSGSSEDSRMSFAQQHRKKYADLVRDITASRGSPSSTPRKASESDSRVTENTTLQRGPEYLDTSPRCATLSALNVPSPQDGTRHQSPTQTTRRSASPAVRARSRASSPAPVEASLPPLRSTSVEAYVPLPLFKSPRENYDKSFIHEREFLENLQVTSVNDITSDQLEKAQAIHQSLCDFTLHQDLIGAETFSQASLTPSRLAQWATSISSKFRFLQQLFSSLSHCDTKHVVALFIKPGRAYGYVERILTGFDIDFSCLHRDSNSMSQSQDTAKPKVLLIGTGDQRDMQGIGKVSLIIGLDETFSLSSPFVQRLRLRTGSEVIPPAIGLVVPLSTEHYTLDVDLKNALEKPRLLQSILTRSCKHRDKAGILVYNAPSPEALAMRTAEAIMEPSKSLELPSLDSYPLAYLEESNNSSGFHDQSSIKLDETPPNSHNQRTSKPSPAPKRPAENEPASPSLPKRPRRTPQPETVVQGTTPSAALEPTQITESTHEPSTDISKSVPSPARPSFTVPQGAQPPATTQSQAPLVTAPPQSSPSHHGLRAEIATLRSQLKATKRSESDLLLRQKSYERQLGVYIPQHAELYRKNQVLEAQLAPAAHLSVSLAKSDESVQELMRQRRELGDQLNVANNLLAGSGKPELEELAELRKKAAEADTLRNRLKTRDQEFEYMRGMYQNASASAANSSSELVLLKEENATLKERLESAETLERVKLNDQFSSTAVEKAHAETKKLRITLTARDRLLDTVTTQRNKLKEENDALKERVGVGLHTRASSVRASSVPGQAGSHLTPASAANAGRGGERPRPSGELLKAVQGAAAGVARTGGGSRSTSRVGSRSGSRAASPGPKAKANARGSGLRG